jgi:hypothetical protein
MIDWIKHIYLSAPLLCQEDVVKGKKMKGKNRDLWSHDKVKHLPAISFKRILVIEIMQRRSLALEGFLALLYVCA